MQYRQPLVVCVRPLRCMCTNDSAIVHKLKGQNVVANSNIYINQMDISHMHMHAYLPVHMGCGCGDCRHIAHLFCTFITTPALLLLLHACISCLCANIHILNVVREYVRTAYSRNHHHLRCPPFVLDEKYETIDDNNNKYYNLKIPSIKMINNVDCCHRIEIMTLFYVQAIAEPTK